MSNLMTRRVAARSLMLAVVAGIAASCQGKTQDQLRADVELIVNGLSGILPSLSPYAPADVLAKVQGYLDDLKANAASVGTALAPNVDAVAKIGEIVNDISGLLTPYLPQAPTVAAIINAALALLPALLAMVGRASPASAVKARASMSPAEARAKLAAAASAKG